MGLNTQLRLYTFFAYGQAGAMILEGRQHHLEGASVYWPVLAWLLSLL